MVHRASKRDILDVPGLITCASFSRRCITNTIIVLPPKSTVPSLKTSPTISISSLTVSQIGAETLTEPKSTSLPGSGSHRSWINSSRLGCVISVAAHGHGIELRDGIERLQTLRVYMSVLLLTCWSHSLVCNIVLPKELSFSLLINVGISNFSNPISVELNLIRSSAVRTKPPL